jgi:hypothetical protein
MKVSIPTTVIALSGFKRSGKDELADGFLRSTVDRFETHSSIVSMADPIRSVVSALYGVFPDEITDKELPISRLKDIDIPVKPKSCLYKSYRYLMDTVGEKLKESLGDKVWIDAIKQNIFDPYFDDYERRYIIIPDIRFIKEQEMLNELKEAGVSVKYGLVLRKAALPEWTKHGLQPTKKDDLKIIKKDFGCSRPEIEWCTTNPKFDFVVTNDGTLEELKVKAGTILSTF